MRAGVVIAAAAVVLVTAGCGAAPTHPRAVTDVRAVSLDATVHPDGTITVDTTTRFADDDGTVVAGAPTLATITGVVVASTPTTDSGERIEIRSRDASLRVGFTVVGAVERYRDVAQVTIPMWAARGGLADRLAAPAVPIAGTVTLPAAPAGRVRLHGAPGADVTVDGATVSFAADVAPKATAELVLTLPSSAVAALPLLRDEDRADYLEDRQRFADRADARLAADIDEARDRAGLIDGGYWTLVALEALIPLLVVLLRVAGAGRRRLEAGAGVPEILRDPPTDDRPAVVALLAADGHDIGVEAVAATILDLADRKQLTIENTGGGSWRMGVHGGDARPGEGELLAALAAAPPPLTGPPLPIPPQGDWWKALRRATVADARQAGYLRRRYPAGLFRAAVVALAVTTAPLWGTSPPAAFAGFGLAAVLAVLPSIGGFVLTDTGLKAQARWKAFNRHLHDNADLGDVDPAGVVVWGPNLVYGTALGQAGTAVAALRPKGDGGATRRRSAAAAVPVIVVLLAAGSMVAAATAAVMAAATARPAQAQGADCAVGSRGDFKASNPRTLQGRMAGRDLSCQDLTGLRFTQADLTGANLSKTRLDGVELGQAELVNADLSGASLVRAELGQANATGARFIGADLTEADLIQTTLTDAQLRGANLTAARMGQAQLQRADLTDATLTGADLTQATVDGARLAGAILKGIEPADVLAADRTGTPFAPATSFAPVECRAGSRTDFKDTVTDSAGSVGSLAGLDLSCQDLTGLKMSFADFKGANLNKAKLAGLELFSADFTGASLIGTDLSGTELTSATMDRVDMRGADFSRASLTSSSLVKVDARQARFDGADLGNVDLTDADLSGASFVKASVRSAKARGAVWEDADLDGAKGLTFLEGADLRGARNRPVNPLLRWLPYGGGALVLLIVLGVLVRRSRGIAGDA